MSHTRRQSQWRYEKHPPPSLAGCPQGLACLPAMEFSLPGSRLTREEVHFVRDIRRVRAQIAESRP